MTSTTCPSCGVPARRVGKIPASSHFAGRVLSESLPLSSLYRCSACLLTFRYPVPDRDRLNLLYAQGADDSWEQGDAHRPDWAIAVGWLAGLQPGQRILDVGCFDGNFLSRVPGSHRLFGVEPHREAAARAEQRGVNVVAHDFAELIEVDETFDVITCFDTIEHVHDPAELLALLVGCLRPGGRLVIGTGNADAVTWRLMGSRYWYCWFPEHIAFVSPRWFRHVAPNLGVRVDRLARHSRTPGNRSFHREAAKNLAYRLMPLGLARRVRVALIRKHGHVSMLAATSPPMWHTARDHFLIELVKD